MAALFACPYLVMSEAMSAAPPATDPDSGLSSATDPDLIAKVRAGDSAAYEELFLRHRDVALRYARRLADRERAEDLCAEAFTKVLDLLQRGKGPDVAFRAYLLTTVRTSHLNGLRSAGKEDLVPDHEPISRMTPVLDDPDNRFDREAVFRAFGSLPERWQVVLWLTAVEGLTHEEVSEHLGLKPNAIASLAFRARAGLRQAFLSEHLLDVVDPACRATVDQLPAYLRGRLTPRRKRQVEDHLARCASCTAASLEVGEVDNNLGAVLAPLALAGLATGSLAAGSTGLLATLKGTGSTLYGAIATKAAAAVTVAAIGTAVTVEVTQHREPAPERPRTDESALVQGPLPVQHPGLVRVVPGAAPTATPVAAGVVGTTPAPQVLAPQTLPQGGAPQPTPTAPSDGPTTPVPETPVTPEPTTTSFGTASARSHKVDGARWDEVTLPVENPTPGTRLDVTTRRTLDSEKAVTTGTGWVCGSPQTNWVDGNLFATTKISCVYGKGGDGGPVVLDFRTLDGATLTAELTPPQDDGGSLLDQLLQLDLRP